MLDVDVAGFDMMDRKLLLAVMQKFDGGPVGVDNLAAAIGEERGTIEDVIEPFLIQQGFLMRTPRGRMATRSAWLHFGLRRAGEPAARGRSVRGSGSRTRDTAPAFAGRCACTTRTPTPPASSTTRIT